MLLQPWSNNAGRMDTLQPPRRDVPRKSGPNVTAAEFPQRVEDVKTLVCFDFSLIPKGIIHFQKKKKKLNKTTSKPAPSQLREVSVQSERDCVPLRDCVNTSGTLDSV